MTEPWTTDFRALREATRRDAPSAQRTRELVLASATVLAAAIAIAIVAFLTPVAYEPGRPGDRRRCG